MKSKLFCLSCLIVCSFFLTTGLGAKQVSSARTSADIEALVANLQLTFGGYTLGKTLSTEQQGFAVNNREEKSYPGTYTFRDHDLRIVVRETDDLILAIYQRFEEVDQAKLKESLAGLMQVFAEPTNVAHDSIVYWSYSPVGKLTGEQFEQMKNMNNGRVDILASVKFSSSRPIEVEDQPTTIYWILSSNPLLEHFVGSSPERKS